MFGSSSISGSEARTRADARNVPRQGLSTTSSCGCSALVDALVPSLAGEVNVGPIRPDIIFLPTYRIDILATMGLALAFLYVIALGVNAARWLTA